jgi:glutaminyl-tRNA synthetase
LNAKPLTPEQKNSERLNKEHLEFSKGRILTRFPPEPNGFLHIGHCKSIRFNFSLAGVNAGETYLRYDDTNPGKEEKKYIDGIADTVGWLGYKPWKVTHSSEYFDQLYGFALKLIQKGKAFVCFQTKEESKATREAEEPSPYRDASVEDNLKQFELMRIGYYNEGQAVLRAKIDYKNGNTTLRDPAIYRISFNAHPHIGEKWCIYPLYDFTHGICDSLENITHSCCTKEFEIRRDLYYWFLVELDLYRPYVYEFARLNMTYTFLSKRKVDKLAKMGVISGWDDPRLYTVQGMRRRGITKEAINYFCDCLSVTRTNNDTTIQVEYFENVVRRDLNENCRRTLAVIDPVKLIIQDMTADETIPLEAPVFPNKKDSKETYNLNLTRVVYMDRSDIRETDSKDFYGVTPGKTVRLKYGPAIKINWGDFKKDKDGQITEMTCQRLSPEDEAKSKPKGIFFSLK